MLFRLFRKKFRTNYRLIMNLQFQQFLNEFNGLKQRFLIKPTHSSRSENSDYGDYQYACKNSFYSFDNNECQNTVYIFDSNKAVNCCDGDYVIESENCYDCAEAVHANNCTYLIYSTYIYDSHFCYNCNNSNNLFGCVDLNHKQYCIFNRQYSKEEYERKVKELLNRPAQKNYQELKNLMLRYPVTISLVSKSENCDYNNQVHFSKNLYLCFDSTHSEDCGYMYDAHYNKNCFDMTQSFHSNFSYECVDGARLNNCHHMNDCWDMYDSGFCENCDHSNHLFGCVNLNNKEYCILNRQYTKNEYEKKYKETLASFNIIKNN